MKYTAEVVGILVMTLGFIAIVFLIAVVAVYACWGWIVPDLLPGAVESGLVVANISWAVAARIAIALTIISALFTKSSTSSSS